MCSLIIDLLHLIIDLLHNSFSCPCLCPCPCQKSKKTCVSDIVLSYYLSERKVEVLAGNHNAYSEHLELIPGATIRCSESDPTGQPLRIRNKIKYQLCDQRQQDYFCRIIFVFPRYWKSVDREKGLEFFIYTDGTFHKVTDILLPERRFGLSFIIPKEDFTQTALLKAYTIFHNTIEMAISQKIIPEPKSRPTRPDAIESTERWVQVSEAIFNEEVGCPLM